MIIKKLSLSTTVIIFFLTMSSAGATEKIDSLNCNKKDYTCCRVDYGFKLEPEIEKRLFQKRLVLIKGSGCPAMYYPDEGIPKFLFLISSECSPSVTPIIEKPSHNPNTWQFQSIPGNCTSPRV